jgi:hypothetical protein
LPVFFEACASVAMIGPVAKPTVSAAARAAMVVRVLVVFIGCLLWAGLVCPTIFRPEGTTG